MDFKLHANHVAKKCNAFLFSYYPIQRLLSYESKLLLIDAYVLSSINYAFSVWGNGSLQTKKTIDKILRSAARFIFNFKKFDPISRQLNLELEWLNSKYRFQFECLKFAFKIINNMVPDKFLNYLNIVDTNTRATRQQTYVTPLTNLPGKYGEKSLKFNATKLWINLPTEIQNCNSFPLFKKTLMAHLLTKQLTDSEDNLHDLNYCDL